jgi:general secretion pathway protein C
MAGVVGRFNHNQCMFVRVCAFVIWALVAGTVVFWGLRMFVRSPEAPAHAVPVGAAVAVRGDLARLLGAAPVASVAAVAAPEASSRFRLVGVMAPKAGPQAEASGQGVALIAVDGKPARAFAVGARLDNDLVLQAVSLRTASIGPPEGAATVKLEIPPLPAPATGTLPSGIQGGATSVSPLPALPPPVTPVATQAIPNVAPPVMVASPPVPPQQPQISAPSPMPNSSAPRREFGAASR